MPFHTREARAARARNARQLGGYALRVDRAVFNPPTNISGRPIKKHARRIYGALHEDSIPEKKRIFHQGQRVSHKTIYVTVGKGRKKHKIRRTTTFPWKPKSMLGGMPGIGKIRI